ncbi:VapE domain-containing protein [Thiomicrorhabdus sp.]|uniref:VapE domain-containing protein n=1 Tax=Thiomicrorhabdus sp. TaxID=2039724 RepID=UPI0029C92598|nr:VapE domain-containing protein [Thiomicrorhabdus sp.]
MSVSHIKQVLEGDRSGFVMQWLPGGKVDGHEYKALNPNRSDSRIGSFSVNLNTGAWADFATGDKGGDLISLYAFVFCNGDNSAAVKQLAKDLNIDLSKPAQSSTKQVNKKIDKFAGWTLSHVRDDSPIVPVAHYKRGPHKAQWAYHNASGDVVGFIRRFEKTDGSKEVLPITIWQSPDNSQQAWRWAHMPEPRLLYQLPALASAKKVLVVEGEKTAEAAIAGLSNSDLIVTTWSGGSKSVAKTDWSPLAGKVVTLWPDADEPGYQAMTEIGNILLKIGCEVWMVKPPADAPAGWDCADLVASDASIDLLAWLRACIAPIKKIDADSNDKSWMAGLMYSDKGKLLPYRDNIFQILQFHSDWSGVFSLNEFTGSIEVTRDNPLGIVGEINDQHDLELGFWLSQNFGMVINSPVQITHGVQMAAYANRYHPVKDYLNGLQWDGQQRLFSWMPVYLGAPATDYTCLVSTFFLIGMVARIFEPGCQMQHMPILEGRQGGGKSSALRILGGEWFSDSIIDIGNKDSYIGIQGVWLQEMAELDSFNKKDATAIKSFVTAQTDKFREPYGRRDVKRPRQCVFAGSTNQHEYFKDPTGNRRFWPIPVGDVDTDGLKAVRDQLFAEAVTLYKNGTRWHPTRDEEIKFFKPEQDEREITDPREQKIMAWLHDHKQIFLHEVTTLQIMEQALDTHISKADNGRQLATYIGQVMAKNGWLKKRSADRRTTIYLRPKA